MLLAWQLRPLRRAKLTEGGKDDAPDAQRDLLLPSLRPAARSSLARRKALELMDWASVCDRRKRAEAYGFAFSGSPPVDGAFTPKPGSHDDGPLNGPFLGGIGTANFSRDLFGDFTRWHLEQGVHAHQRIDACFLAVSWESEGIRHGRRLSVGEGAWRFAAAQRSYATLFPVTYEHFAGDMPFEIVLESYSPTVPGDLASSALPLTIFNVHLKSVGRGPCAVSLAFVWPHLLGWKQFAQTPERREGQLWPAFGNAGNFCEGAGDLAPDMLGVAQRRASVEHDGDALFGETVLCVAGDGRLGRELCFMAESASTGVPAAEQRYTLGHVEDRFLTTGRLPEEECSWIAHWHEPLASAVSAELSLDEGSEARTTFLLVHDWPLTTFGAGRRWNKRYTADFGRTGRSGSAIACHARANNDRWLADIGRWQDASLSRFESRGISRSVAGCALNELSFVVGGGSAWVVGQCAETVEDTPVLSQAEHFGLLEGFDTGYFYYNTSDLWTYAFAGIGLNWPELAGSVFDDYLESIPLSIERQRPTYRSGAIAPLLVAGKLPHDLGAAADDPWVRLNGYSLRDDPNLWKDHNPSFIVSFLLHAELTGQGIDREAYQRLKAAADFIARQDRKGRGVPEHDEFGDSTWDNLQMEGLSTYAGAFCLAAWAGMERLAGAMGEAGDAAMFGGLRVKASAALGTLWNGSYYLTNDRGKYGKAVMADAVLGIFYARLAGLPDLVPEERMRGHLRAVYEHSFLAYADGRVGPLLVSEPGRLQYEGDGGQELQVNEVIVGAAWMYVAMLTEYGLSQEADRVARTMRDMIYGGTGLQFRTPAAWNAEGRYRAPLNMRPLATWLLAAVGRTKSETPRGGNR